MKGKIKKILPLLLLSFIFLPLFIAEARSGCCSHHGGVCGCSCCDGTSLSATCAPYYPQCNSKPVQNYTPPASNYNPPAPVTEKPLNSQNYTAELPKNNEGSAWWWIAGIGIVGFIIHKFIKK